MSVCGIKPLPSYDLGRSCEKRLGGSLAVGGQVSKALAGLFSEAAFATLRCDTQLAIWNHTPRYSWCWLKISNLIS